MDHRTMINDVIQHNITHEVATRDWKNVDRDSALSRAERTLRAKARSAEDKLLNLLNRQFAVVQIARKMVKLNSPDEGEVIHYLGELGQALEKLDRK